MHKQYGLEALETSARRDDGYVLACFKWQAAYSEARPGEEFERLQGPPEPEWWVDPEDAVDESFDEKLFIKYAKWYGGWRAFLAAIRIEIRKAMSVDELYDLADECRDHDDLAQELDLIGFEDSSFEELAFLFAFREAELRAMGMMEAQRERLIGVGLITPAQPEIVLIGRIFVASKEGGENVFWQDANSLVEKWYEVVRCPSWAPKPLDSLTSIRLNQ